MDCRLAPLFINLVDNPARMSLVVLELVSLVLTSSKEGISRCRTWSHHSWSQPCSLSIPSNAAVGVVACDTRSRLKTRDLG
jgi:hypothetical protein